MSLEKIRERMKEQENKDFHVCSQTLNCADCSSKICHKCKLTNYFNESKDWICKECYDKWEDGYDYCEMRWDGQ